MSASMAEGIAGVLSAHEVDYTYDGKQTGCSCGHWQARGPVSAHADHASHQASVLAANGYGKLEDAWDACNATDTPWINPYRRPE